MVSKFSAPRGTADILPLTIPLWQNIEYKARSVFHLYGYKEIRTPYFEELDLFCRSMGESSDVVRKQMLHLTSQQVEDVPQEEKKGLTLRPEGTASVIRSYIENNLDKQEGLSKLFYIGPMFRGERPQKGRLRQFHQIGAEAIGPESCDPLLDAEIIALSTQILNELGLKSYQLKINSLGTSEDKQMFSRLLREQLNPLRSSLCQDCQVRFELNILRVLDCKNKSCQSLIKGLNLTDAYLSEESRQYFLEVRKALDNLKISYEISLQLVRGLDYYTHTVFEISHSQLGSQDALGAGGRYNNLVGDLGGPSVDAVGFALGIERIILAMPEDQNKPVSGSIESFLIVLDDKAIERAFCLLQDLRKERISCEMSFKPSSLKSQMRLANKLQAQYVLILGEEELTQNKISLKEMKTGQQEKIGLSEIISVLKNKKKRIDSCCGHTPAVN